MDTTKAAGKDRVKEKPYPTWGDLCELEPRLEELFDVARSYHLNKGTDFCANRRWYRTLKPRLERLVGWHRKDNHPTLCSRQAYDLAYQAIYEALPDCRGYCSCLCIDHAVPLRAAEVDVEKAEPEF